MLPSTDEQIALWVATWHDAGAALERHKRAELERLETPHALAILAGAFAHARRQHGAPGADTSGLVEQQRCFQRLRR